MTEHPAVARVLREDRLRFARYWLLIVALIAGLLMLMTVPSLGSPIAMSQSAFEALVFFGPMWWLVIPAFLVMTISLVASAGISVWLWLRERKTS